MTGRAACSARHDYIQWLFPLRSGSAFNADAPLLDAADIAAFRADSQLQGRLRAAWQRMLGFYGFAVREESGALSVTPAATWNERARVWLTPHNHNYLRISRILQSLTLLGLNAEARAFHSKRSPSRSRGSSTPASSPARRQRWAQERDGSGS